MQNSNNPPPQKQYRNVSLQSARFASVQDSIQDPTQRNLVIVNPQFSRNSGPSQFGQRNSGPSQFGRRNSGLSQFGQRNGGYPQVGQQNTGFPQAGQQNAGFPQAGQRNSGFLQVGQQNAGFPQNPQRTVNTQTVPPYYNGVGSGSRYSASDTIILGRAQNFIPVTSTTNPVTVVTPASYIPPGLSSANTISRPGMSIKYGPTQTQQQWNNSNPPTRTLVFPNGDLQSGRQNQLRKAAGLPLDSQGNQLRVLDSGKNAYDVVDKLLTGGMDDGAYSAFRPMLNSLFQDAFPKCPDGMEVLLDTENIFIQRAEADFAEAFFNVPKKYDVINTYGERLYFAGELSQTLNRPNCCGLQKFNVSLIGRRGGEVFQFRGTNYVAYLYDQNNDLMGSIETRWRCFDTLPSFIVRDATCQILYQISHETGNQNEYDYLVVDQYQDQIGRLSKLWVSLPCADQDLPYSYGISFPVQLDVQNKAILMGVLFVAYFRFFEDTNRERRNNYVSCCGIICFAITFVVLVVILGLLVAHYTMH